MAKSKTANSTTAKPKVRLASRREHERAEQEHGQRKLHAASFSVLVNSGLILLKLVIAAMTGSIAILAELFHSAFDLIASLLAFFGIKKASEPADAEHPYGHEKFENLSSLAQTLLIVLTSVFIIYEAIGKILHPHPIDAIGWGIIVMVVTVVADSFVSRYLHKASAQYGSSALEADAYHFSTDLWSAVAVILGLGFVYLGDLLRMPGLAVFDAIAAIIVAILMLWVSYHLGMRSLSVMLDHSPKRSLMRRIVSIVDGTPGVRKMHKLRVRQAGSKLFVDLHIWVAPRITVASGHLIAHEAKRRLMARVPSVKDVTIHVEPAHERGWRLSSHLHSMDSAIRKSVRRA